MKQIKLDFVGRSDHVFSNGAGTGFVHVSKDGLIEKKKSVARFGAQEG